MVTISFIYYRKIYVNYEKEAVAIEIKSPY